MAPEEDLGDMNVDLIEEDSIEEYTAVEHHLSSEEDDAGAGAETRDSEEKNITEDIAVEEQTTPWPTYNPSDPNLFVSQYGRKYKIPQEGIKELLIWATSADTKFDELKNTPYKLEKYEKEYYKARLLVIIL